MNSESGLSVSEKRKARFIQGGRSEAGPEPANDGSGELRIFLPKIGLSVRFTILSIWIAAPR